MNGPVEPRADIRMWATNLYQMWIALTSAGFNNEQTMDLIGRFMLASNIAGMLGDDQ